LNLVIFDNIDYVISVNRSRVFIIVLNALLTTTVRKQNENVSCVSRNWNLCLLSLKKQDSFSLYVVNCVFNYAYTQAVCCSVCDFRFQFIHKVIYYVVVNLPFFVIRLVIWHLHDKHISVFLVKNVLGLGLAVQHLHEVLLEVSHVITSDVRGDDSANVSPQHEGPHRIEMQQLTTAAEAKESRHGETLQSAEISSAQV